MNFANTAAIHLLKPHPELNAPWGAFAQPEPPAPWHATPEAVTDAFRLRFDITPAAWASPPDGRDTSRHEFHLAAFLISLRIEEDGLPPLARAAKPGDAGHLPDFGLALAMPEQPPLPTPDLAPWPLPGARASGLKQMHPAAWDDDFVNGFPPAVAPDTSWLLL